jgi:serine kinase of HPr protein (carbohydrate metabolism regulator)
MSVETVHASCVAIGGRGVLLRGPSGSGKSDLALRLIDRGAVLVSDDYTHLTAADGRLLAAAPERIAGCIEVRGIGIVPMEAAQNATVCLVVDLADPPQRMPEPEHAALAGSAVPLVRLSALEASAPIKVETALLLLGLPLP